MKKSEYLNWLIENKIYTKRKLQTDCASRAQRVENALFSCLPGFMGFDEEYKIDKGVRVMNLLSKRGLNDEMQKHPVEGLPLGSNQMDTLCSAVKKYFAFLSTTDG